MATFDDVLSGGRTPATFTGVVPEQKKASFDDVMSGTGLGFKSATSTLWDVQQPTQQALADPAFEPRPTRGPHIKGFEGEPRSDDIWKNAGKDFGEMVDGYKTLGTMIADDFESGEYTKTLSMVAENFLPAIAQSYTRWYDAYEQGGMEELGKKMMEYPVQFAQDVSLPLTFLLGGAGGIAKGVNATSKTAKALSAAAKVANVVEIGTDPIGGLIGFGAQKAAGKAFRTVTGKTPQAKVGKVISEDLDVNVHENLLKEEALTRGYTVDKADEIAKTLVEEPKLRTDPAMSDIWESTQRRLEKFEESSIEDLAKRVIEREADLGGTPTPEKYAKSINLRFLNGRDEVKRLLVQVTREMEKSPAGKKTIQTWAQTEELANASGKTAKDMLDGNLEKSALGVVDTEVARRILNHSVAETDIMYQVARNTPTDLNYNEFYRSLATTAAIKDVMDGHASTAGRVLNIYKKFPKMDKVQMSHLRTMIEKAGGKTEIDKMMKVWNEMDVGQKVSGKAAKDMLTPTKWKQFYETWIGMGLLSGLVTQIKNISSNAVVATYVQGLEGLATSMVSAASNPLRRAAGKSVSEITMGENLGRMGGFARGISAGAKAFVKNVKEGEAFGGRTPLEHQLGAVPGVAGMIVRAPLRMLESFDSFFKALNFTSEFEGLAVRKALTEVKQGIIDKSEIAARVAAIVEEKPSDLFKEAMDIADRNTFTNELGGDWMTEFAKLIQTAKNNKFFGKPISMMVPFVRTPANIAKFAADRTPMAFLFKNTRDELIGKYGKEVADRARARVALGTAIGATIYMHTDEGIFTGGLSTDRNKRDLERLTGYQPYSIHWKGNFYSYANVEPLGSLLGVSADFGRLMDMLTGPEVAGNAKDLERIPGLIVQSIGKNFTSKTYMKGLSDAIEAFSDSERYMDQWINNLVSTVIPSAVSQAARAEDPYLRQARTLIEKIQNRTFSRSRLAFRMNLWGQPIKREQPFNLGKWAGVVNPVYFSQDKKDKTANEMLKLGVFPGMPSNTITIQGIKIKLTPEEYTTYVQQSGIPAKEVLDSYTYDKSWESQTDTDKAHVLDRIIREYRRKARENLPRFHKDITRRVKEAQLEKQQRSQ